jgi:hypothetical protein
MFGPNPTTNIWIQGFWVMIGQRFTCHDLMFSGHTTFLQLCAHFFSLYTNYDWRVKWFSWLAAYTGSFLLLIQRWHYSVDVLVGIAITAGVVFGYHAAVWSYHAYMKIGQMGFQWSNPFTVFLRLVWWMDGLDYDLLTVSNNDPIVPNTNVSAEQRRRK